MKDVIDVAGVPTGAGQPTWAATHPVPSLDADVVAALLGAGAQYVGKSHTDELAYSLFGSNHHHGTPPNPRAPGHLPGGSSSGAAASVAAGLADIGLGTDTAGSIRVPASWCGLLGLRPTHGRVSRRGVVPLAPRFDVPGLITRDLATMRRASGTLLSEAGAAGSPLTRLLVADRHWSDPALRAALQPGMDRLSSALPVCAVQLAAAPVAAFAASQGAQAWRVHGGWITRHRPSFGPGVGDRFRAAAGVTGAAEADADRRLTVLSKQLRSQLEGGGVLVLPTTPCSAPPVADPPGGQTRSTLISLTMLASAAGLPALSVPVGRLDGRPLGLSLVAAPGQDENLLELAATLADVNGFS